MVQQQDGEVPAREVFPLLVPLLERKIWPAYELLICPCRLPALVILKAGSITVTSI